LAISGSGSGLISLRSCGPEVFCADVGGEFFFTSGFVITLHFI
jgi:hypothetical protein